MFAGVVFIMSNQMLLVFALFVEVSAVEVHSF
jgi:hypothetical protein